MINDKEELLTVIRNRIKVAFEDIEFIEWNHTYYHKLSNKFLPSVTKKYKEFEVPFDTSIAKWSAKAKGVTEEEILFQWKEKGRISAERGTRIHKFAEAWYIDNLIQPSCDAERGVIEFFKDHPNYIVINQELILFHKLYMFAGTMDLLLFDIDTEEFIVADWKSNEDLHKNYKKKTLLTPFDDYLDTPLNKYKIQLNLYDICLEDEFPIERRIIIWLEKDSVTNKKYQLFEVEDLKPRLKEYYGSNS